MATVIVFIFGWRSIHSVATAPRPLGPQELAHVVISE